MWKCRNMKSEGRDFITSNLFDPTLFLSWKFLWLFFWSLLKKFATRIFDHFWRKLIYSVRLEKLEYNISYTQIGYTYTTTLTLTFVPKRKISNVLRNKSDIFAIFSLNLTLPGLRKIQIMYLPKLNCWILLAAKMQQQKCNSSIS